MYFPTKMTNCHSFSNKGKDVTETCFQLVNIFSSSNTIFDTLMCEQGWLSCGER